jgi:hypothetical protein
MDFEKNRFINEATTNSVRDYVLMFDKLSTYFVFGRIGEVILFFEIEEKGTPDHHVNYAIPTPLHDHAACVRRVPA